MLYDVYYKKPGAIFWHKIKDVEGDSIIETGTGVPLPARAFFLVNKIRVEIPMNCIFKFSKERYYDIQANLDTGRLKKELKKKGYEIKDIAVIIHNHLTVCRFSDEDHKRYRRLKKYGFEGLFLVYCHTSDKVYDIEYSD